MVDFDREAARERAERVGVPNGCGVAVSQADVLPLCDALDAAEVTIARVRALAEGWLRNGPYVAGGHSIGSFGESLLAALDGPTPSKETDEHTA